MSVKKQFTMADADSERFDQLAESCGMTHSQLLSQYIRRYSDHLDSLLSTSSNLSQPVSTSSNLSQSKYAEVESKSTQVSETVTQAEPSAGKKSALSAAFEMDFD